MPTADEFDRAAASFDRAAAKAETLLGSTRGLFGSDTMRDGLLPLLVDVTIDTTERNTLAIAAELHDQADTCRQRAAACRAYTEQLAAYHRDIERWGRGIREASDEAATGLPPRGPSKLRFIEI